MREAAIHAFAEGVGFGTLVGFGFAFVISLINRWIALSLDAIALRASLRRLDPTDAAGA